MPTPATDALPVPAMPRSATPWYETLRLMTGIGLSLALILPGMPARAQTQAGTLELPATVDSMAKGGLFFPGSGPGTVLPGQQVAAEVNIDISGMVARTTVTQHFVNPKDEWVEALYVFPLPETSAVDRLKLTVGEREIDGKIKPRKLAQQQFEQARAKGQTASLLTQERPNIFTNAVTNIAPHEAITVQIGFEQPVDYLFDPDKGPLFWLRFPMAIMPRYIPGQPKLAALTGEPEPAQPSGQGWSFDTDQVPDASRITPPVADPTGPKVNPVHLSVHLNTGFPLGDLTNSYHTIRTAADEAGRYEINLARDAVPADRDFELSWSPVPGAGPSAGLFAERQHGFDHYLLMLSPPAPDADNVQKAGEEPREITFILDKSGSMAGEPIRQAREALTTALKRLRPGDRFNVIAFDNQHRQLFPQPVPADSAHIQQAIGWVSAIDASGGTEMLPALSAALSGALEQPDSQPHFLRQIVFITDGAVGNEDALLGLVSKRLGDRRLFTIGIGSAPNGHFMREMANAGRGTFTFIGNGAQVGERMRRLLRQLEAPVLTDISVSLPDGAEAYPPIMPDLYAGEPVRMVMRLPEDTKGTLHVTGKLHGQPWQRDLSLTPPTADAGNGQPADKGIAALWARQKIAELERVNRRAGNGGKADDSILEVALDYQLLSRLTSLIAVDSEVRRPMDATLTSGAVAGNMPAGATMPAPVSTPAQPTLVPIAAPTNPFSPGNLPKTATPADMLFRLGLLSLLVGLVLLLVARKRWHGPSERMFPA